ncbi:MAG: hypothetical protein ACUVSX_02835 [Aggregatilineales bacterium]
MANRLSRSLLTLVLLKLMTSCALGDIGRPTLPPPITLAPPPTAIFEGACDQTPVLDAWLQATATFLVPEFMTTLTAAAGKSRAEVYADVLRLARLRDAASDRPTPDCATELQLILMDAMNTAVNRFQAYANGEAVSISEAAAEAIARLEQVTALQNELISRLEEQYRAERGR